MKKLGIFLLIIFVIIFVGAGVIYSKVTDAIQAESENNDLIGAKITIGDVSLNPFSGTAGLAGFTIGQPDGFGSDDSMSVDAFLIDLKPLTLFDDVLEIETIVIDKPVLNLVIVDNETNFGAIQRQLDETLGESEDSDIKVILQDFYLNNLRVNIQSEQYGNHDVELADIHLTNIGVDENGVAPKEIFRLAMDAIKPQVGKLLLELGIRNRLSNEFNRQVGDQIQQQLEGLPDPVKDAADQIKGRLGLQPQ